MSENEKKNITDDLEIIDFFRSALKAKERLWIWQQESNGERPVHLCNIRKFDVLKKSLELTPLSDEGFSFKYKENPIFLYSRKKNIAVKFNARELESHFITMSVPERLNHLSPELAAKINLVEEEDETGKAEMRQQPRKSAGDNQMAGVIREGQAKIQWYRLYDISAGGLALNTEDPGTFKKGDIIRIVSINYKDLPKEFTGKVVSIRHMVEDDSFKVGVQFI